MSAFLYRLGRACFRAPGRVLAAWLALLAVFGVLALTVGGSYDDAFTIPGSSSEKALETLEVTFPEAADASATIVIGAPPGSRVDTEANKRIIEDYLAGLEDDLPFVKGTQSPFSEFIDGLVSDDASHALARVRVEGTVSTFTDEQRAELVAAAQRLTEELPGATVDVGGDVFAMHLPEFSAVEAIGVLVAIVVLVIVLGGLLAAMMPIATALSGVGISVFIVMAGTGVLAINSTTLMLVVMLGLAVGIDYALFIISRHRDQLGTGMDVEESAARAVATAGSAVVFAGLTVIIALVGLSIAGLPFLSVMGIFTAVGVGLEVLLALTLLPALMGLAGERLRPKPRKTPIAAGSGRASRWWVGVVTRWPLITVLVVVVGMGALALPARDLQMGLPNSGRAVPGEPDRIAFDLTTREFGIGFNGPLVITGSIVESDDPMAVLDGIRADVEAIPGVEMVAAAVPNANADTAMIQVIPTSGPDEQATSDLVDRLRERHDDWLEEYGIDTSITGLTAASIDVNDRLRGALLPFGLFVVGLSLVLLMMAFRSIWVPVKAALGYLLSVGAAFGAVKLVFNDGVGGWLINLPEPVPVISFLPIILMGILFGLAMDYEVFLTSRMREEYIHGNPNWIQDGFTHSAKVVIAAALIMFSVFVFFVPTGIGVVKPIALGLALGVAFDAFLVRMTLGPAVMKLMGRAAWWLPAWLDRRLPVLDVEGEALAHQTRLAAWPEATAGSAVYAEGLAAAADGHTIFEGVSLDLPRGEVLVVEGDRLARLALVLGLSGRAGFTGGEAKVLDRVLPEEAPLVRRKAPVLLDSTDNFDAELALGAGGIVFVPAADELPEDKAAAVRAALAARHTDPTTTWVLGVAPDGGREILALGTDLPVLAPDGYRVLRLTSELDLAAGVSR